MERHRTRIWRGGLAELVESRDGLIDPEGVVADLRLEPGATTASSRRIALAMESVPSFAATRVMSADELQVLRQVQRAVVRPNTTRAPSEAEPVDAELHLLTARIGRSARVRKRVLVAVLLALLVAVCWYGRRASATSRPAATRLANTPQLPVKAPALLPAHQPAQTAPPVPSALPNRVPPAGATSSASHVLPRAGVDALAAGDDLSAAALYRTLASQAVDGTPYEAAAEILTARAQAKKRAAKGPRR